MRRLSLVFLYCLLVVLSLFLLGYLSNLVSALRYKSLIRARMLEEMTADQQAAVVWLDSKSVQPGLSKYWYAARRDIKPPWAFVVARTLDKPFVVSIYYGHLEANQDGRGAYAVYVSVFGLTLVEQGTVLWEHKLKSPT